MKNNIIIITFTKYIHYPPLDPKKEQSYPYALPLTVAARKLFSALHSHLASELVVETLLKIICYSTKEDILGTEFRDEKKPNTAVIQVKIVTMTKTMSQTSGN